MNDAELLAIIAQAEREGWTKLDLSGNDLRKLPSEIGQLQSLEKLILGKYEGGVKGNRLTAIPQEVFQLTNLKELSIPYNQITAIPDAIANLANLTTLYLYSNQITAIPDAIAQLSNLTTLRLDSNQITAIPDAIGNLANLTTLNIGSNQLSTLPLSISQLSNLKFLNIGLSTGLIASGHGNKFKEIPNSILSLPSLENLNLWCNLITMIPDAIANLANLCTLNLSYNQITQIPEAIEKIPKLEKLDLRRNPLPISPEILGGLEPHEDSGAVEDIFNYLRQLRSGEVLPLNEAKLILIGQGSVGKTSLIKKLVHNCYNPNEQQTDGLNVEPWEIQVNSKDIRLNVWDFGGQEIYHATHQFFLTKCSLYLLVCNCRTSEAENRIEYWLKLIKIFGDQSPVIIVGNKKDEQPFDINRKVLREKYPNIQAIIETSCQDNIGIDEPSAIILFSKVPMSSNPTGSQKESMPYSAMKPSRRKTKAFLPLPILAVFSILHVTQSIAMIISSS